MNSGTVGVSIVSVAALLSVVMLVARGAPISGALSAVLVVLGALLVAVHLLMAVPRRVRKQRVRVDGREVSGNPAGVDEADGGDHQPSVWYPERTFRKADAAIEIGELWRAKEILQGTLASQPYHPELYERYGRVLLQMGDLLNAGMYLLLSGRQDESFQHPISLFVNRFRGKDAGELVRVLPSRARDLDSLPSNVTDELALAGWKGRDLRRASLRKMPQPAPGWLESVTIAYLLFAFLAVLAFGLTELLTAARNVLPWIV